MSSASVRLWCQLVRPWSFTATLVPFLLGASLAVMFNRDIPRFWGLWFGGLVVGLLFHATVNLLNVWGDDVSGVDRVPGAVCTTPQLQQGLVTHRALLIAAGLCAGVSVPLGLLVCFYSHAGAWHFNIPVLAIGAIGFLGAVNYSTGFKFKYRGLGVPFVSLLMGPLEIAAAYFLLVPTAPFPPAHWGRLLFLMVPVAIYVGMIMHANDMRDIRGDTLSRTVTLASFLGARRALVAYVLFHLVPYAFLFVLPVVFAFQGYSWLWVYLPLCVLPLSIKTIRTAHVDFKANTEAPDWRTLEGQTAQIHFLFGMLFVVASVLFKLQGL